MQIKKIKKNKNSTHKNSKHIGNYSTPYYIKIEQIQFIHFFVLIKEKKIYYTIILYIAFEFEITVGR